MFFNSNPHSFFQRLFGRRPGRYINSIEIAEAEPDEDNWIKIVPVGEFPEHPSGAHVITSEHIRQMEQNFNNSGTDLLFDIDHVSLWGDTRAAAWSSQVQAREDGLYIKYPDFTPSASKAIENKEYRYFSPVYLLDKTDKKGNSIGAVIDSVAITNRPYMDVEINHIGNTMPVRILADTTRNQKSNDMKLSKESLKKLGLPEDASEEQVNEAIANSQVLPGDGGNGGSGKQEEAPKAHSKTAEPTPGPSQEETDSELMAKINSLEARLAAREKQEAEEKAEALVNSAVAAGKILPADQPAWLTAAKADYSATKAALDGRKANSALPGKVQVDGRHGPEQPKKNSVEACADYLRAQMGAATAG